MPILRVLIKYRRSKSVNEARELLKAFLEADQVHKERVFEAHISKAAISLYGLAEAGKKHSDAVHEFLRKHLEPIATLLEKADSRRIRRLGKKVRRAFEVRYSPPTKEEAAASRLSMLRWGMIPYDKMTKAEKAEYDRQMSIQRAERRSERRAAERALGIRRPFGM